MAAMPRPVVCTDAFIRSNPCALIYAASAREEAAKEQDNARARALEKEAERKVMETQESTRRLRQMWRGVGMRIEETAPFTILAVQGLMPEFGDTPRDDLVSVGDVLCTVNAVETRQLNLDEVKSLILGPQGTCVTLGIQSWRSAERYSVTVRRHWELDEEDLPPNAAGATSGLSLLCFLRINACMHVCVGVYLIAPAPPSSGATATALAKTATWSRDASLGRCTRCSDWKACASSLTLFSREARCPVMIRQSV